MIKVTRSVARKYGTLLEEKAVIRRCSSHPYNHTQHINNTHAHANHIQYNCDGP